MVKTLLTSKGIEKRHLNSLGQNALHTAVIGNKPEMVKLLMNGICGSISDSKGLYPIHYAVMQESIELVGLILDADLDHSINQVSGPGFTPLHYACNKGNRQMTSYLLQRGADINAASPNGVTALHLAAGSGSVPLVTLLVEKYDFPINIETIASQSRPIHIAAKEGHI